MAFKIILIYLQLFSILTLSFQKFQENVDDITIYKVIGNLTEYSKSQFITLFINSSNPIDGKDVGQLELYKGGFTYKPNIDCFETSTFLDTNTVNCYLDLTKISFGIYKIKSFTYNNEKKPADVTFEIKEIGDKKDSEIHLTSFYGEIREFQENQHFELVFDKNIQVPSRLQRMKIINNQNKKYSINIRCSKDDHSTVSLNCIGDYPLNFGKYQIEDILFYNGENNFEFIQVGKNIVFEIKEDILQLKRVYGEAHNETFNLMGLIFQDIVYTKYFSKFFLRNVQTNKDYEINFKFVSETSITADQKIMFDFSGIPLGEYYVNFVYKRHEHINDAIINIKQLKKIDISYDDEGINN